MLLNFKLDEFGKILVKYASSQLFSNLISLASGFLILRILEPEIYGLFSGYGIYLGYILLLHLGVMNGLSRELPFQLGKGNSEYSKELASSAFLLSSAIGAIVSLVFLTFAIINYAGFSNLFVVLISYSVISFFHLNNSLLLPFLYRTNRDFQKLSVQQIKVGLMNLVTVSLVWKYGLYGLCLRGILLALFTFFLFFKEKPINLKLLYSPKNLKALLKLGLPIFFAGRVNPLWQTVMNNYIFVAGGALSYGYYAIAVVVQNTLSVIPVSISQVIYPRMAIMYGEGKPIDEIIYSNIKPLFYQFFLLLFFSIIGYFLLPVAIAFLLPEYSNGISAAQWTIFIPVVMSLGALNNIYNVIGKQKYYLISLISGAVIGTLYVFASIQHDGFSLEKFPQGMLIGIFFQQLLGLFLITRIIKNAP